MCFMHGKSLAGLSSSCRLPARLPEWVTMGAEGTEPVYTQLGAPAQTLGLSPRRLMAYMLGHMLQNQVGWRKILECQCTLLRHLTALPDF